jgi:low affinity Fe/Cu permease
MLRTGLSNHEGPHTHYLVVGSVIRSTSGAHNIMLTLEDLSLEEIETFRTYYEKLAMTAREKLRQGQADTSIPAITIG